jgi:chitinase
LLLLFIGFSQPVSRLASMPLTQVEQWSVAYWTPWGNPPIPVSEIDWEALTHVVHWAALVQPDGSLDLERQRVSSDGPALIATAHEHGVKVLLGVAQATWIGHRNAIQQAADSDMPGLVNHIIEVVDTYGFDGVDLDWEPFSPRSNGRAMQQLAEELRSRLGDRILSAAAIVNHSEFWGSIHGYFDRIHLMTYDLTGTWNPYSWHNAALYSPEDSKVWSVDMAIRLFTSAGVPHERLSVGIPFFGWLWSGSGITGPQQHWGISAPQLAQTYYQRLAPMISPTTLRWDDTARVPYLSFEGGDGQFLTYDNESSVVEKVNYAKAYHLGGWFIWELSAGYLPSQIPSQPLLEAIKQARHSEPPEPAE